MSCVGQSRAERGQRALDTACPICTAATSWTSSRPCAGLVHASWAVRDDCISESPPGVVSYLAAPSQQHGTLVWWDSICWSKCSTQDQTQGYGSMSCQQGRVRKPRPEGDLGALGGGCSPFQSLPCLSLSPSACSVPLDQERIFWARTKLCVWKGRRHSPCPEGSSFSREDRERMGRDHGIRQCWPYFGASHPKGGARRDAGPGQLLA